MTANDPQSFAVTSSTNATGRTILFVLTSHDILGDTGKPTGFHLAEVTHVWRRLRENGHRIDFASIQGGPAPMDARDESDPINSEFLKEEDSSRAIAQTKKITEVHARDYDGVYFAGGHGAMWDFMGNPDVQRIVRNIYERGGVVAAICHGVAALAGIQLTDGRYLLKRKQVTSFTNAEEKSIGCEGIVPFALQDKIEKEGAEFVAGENFKPNVAVAGQLVTGQNPASARGVADAMIEYLGRSHAIHDPETPIKKVG